MLETTSSRLFTEKGSHYGSPDKDPRCIARAVLTDAGRLSVPFTTGILVRDRGDPTRARRVDHGHPCQPQGIRAHPGSHRAELPRQAGHGDARGARHRSVRVPISIAVARLPLGPAMRVQAPPNLVDAQECAALIAAGIDDWGGVSPLTPTTSIPNGPGRTSMRSPTSPPPAASR